MCVVVPHPDEGLEDLVLGGQLGHVRDHLALGEASVEFRELHRVDSDLFRDGVVDQGVDVIVSAVFRHVRLLVRRRGVVAARESVSRLNRIDGDRTRLVMVVVFGEIDGSVVVVVGEERGEGRDVARRSVGDDGRDVVRGDLAVTVSFRFVNEASHDASVSEPTCALHGDLMIDERKWEGIRKNEERLICLSSFVPLDWLVEEVVVQMVCMYVYH